MCEPRLACRKWSFSSSCERPIISHRKLPPGTGFGAGAAAATDFFRKQHGSPFVHTDQVTEDCGSNNAPPHASCATTGFCARLGGLCRIQL